ncbi:hypothetical protein K5I29_06630 [Flavobacterium agricola]|uniref:Lipoprotein n=1 Tax=Flavobacterium agricola TaxID=2870839 RepID=A0ABY6M1U5_9FLAO|nr:hypothetical protein [Flavobacterium agricola]UYW02542.1 hypothetical protein K5I29_06630 [Flavobacterium agricola]
MKKIVGLLLLVVAICFSACSNNDFDTNPTLPEVPVSLWPLENFNTWSLGKDTIPKTIVIDSSFLANQTNHYYVNGLMPFFTPPFFVADSAVTYIYADQNVYYLEIVATKQWVNEQEVQFSEFAIPIAIERSNIGDLLTTTSTIQLTYPDVVQQIQVTATSEVLDKYVLEAVGGYVFTEVTKVKNTYTYLWNDKEYVVNREIWFQPGVGPVSIINENQNTTYRIVSYQLYQNQSDF